MCEEPTKKSGNPIPKAINNNHPSIRKRPPEIKEQRTHSFIR